VLCAQSILIHLIWSPELYLVRIQITKLLILQFSPIPHCLHPLLPKYLPQHAIPPFSNTLNPRCCLYMTDHISYSCQITGKIIFPCNLIVICLGIKRRGTRVIYKTTWHYQGRPIMQADRWKGTHIKFCSSALLENGHLNDRHEDGARFRWLQGKCIIRMGV
jgi:hypothetical protein